MGIFFPFVYDVLMKPLEGTKFKNIRKELLSKVEGRVLEIGSGTGINFPFYERGIQVDAVEPSSSMARKSLKRLERTTIPIQTHLAGAEKLPFQDNTFDTIVCTLVFCTIPVPQLAIQEIKRVSKPHVKILFFEHVRLHNARLGKLQDILTPFWKTVCDGCHLNRDTVKLIEEADLTLNRIVHHYKGLFLTIECSLKEK